MPVDVVAKGLPFVAPIFPVLVTFALFTHEDVHSVSDWFTWHPILMSTAVTCLMVWGRWSYVAGSDFGVESKNSRRWLHACLMTAAIVVMLVGYLCIMFSHPKNHFLGYDFVKREWVSFARIVHIYSGYMTILMALEQGFVGYLKFSRLRRGVSSFEVHSHMGKLTLLVGGFCLMTAISFIQWNYVVKKFMLLILIGVIAGATFAPPRVKQEETPLFRRETPNRMGWL